ncbi:MAG: glycosyltransferase family 4 protein [bacterium]|nr:glycosyltransferase family 4 protein [bacterium]
MKKLRVLYIYAGKRTGTPGADVPDTQFYGVNHLDGYGISAEYKEPNTALSRWLGFRGRHLMMYFFSSKYDVVFGSALLYQLLFQKIFRRSTKFVLLNISITRTLRANTGLKLRIITWLLREVSMVVCLSRIQQEQLIEAMPDMRGKTAFVPLGTDAVFHKPIYAGRKEYILSAGRDNGRDYKAVIEVARQLPDEEFHIVCSPRNMIGIDHIPENVSVFFDLSLDEWYQKFKEARMLLLLTQGTKRTDGADCSGQTALVDAMALGLPVVVTAHPYLSDYATDTKEVLVVRPGDVEDICEKIHMLSDPAVRELIAKQARNVVDERLTTAHMARSLAGVFKEVSR